MSSEKPVLQKCIEVIECSLLCYQTEIISESQLKVNLLYAAFGANGVTKEQAEKLIKDVGLDIIVEDTDKNQEGER